MSLVYCHINKANKKLYIGRTNYTDPNMRFGNDGIGYKGSYFYDYGIKNVGWNGFIHLILIEDIYEDLSQQIEARIIKHFNTTNKNNGYNDLEGNTIKKDSVADMLSDNCINKIIKIIQDEFKEDDSYLANYRFETKTYDVDFLYNYLYKENRVNTELDCQRGYTWTEDRQQGMWDTLLRHHRIPEFHVICDGLHYDVVDGKQRFTTIIKILNNEIPFQLKTANKTLKQFFPNDKTKLYFKDLPSSIQTSIMKTSITMAEYTNIQGEELVDLFKKLNASMPLTEFSKGIASNINIRTNFTRFLISHNTIKLFFSEKSRLNSEDELFLVRLMILLRDGIGAHDLQPRNMCNYYSEVTNQELYHFKEIIQKTLDTTFPYCSILQNFNKQGSLLPIIYYIIITENLSDDKIKELFKIAANYSGFVRGTNFSKAKQEERYKYFLSKIS